MAMLRRQKDTDAARRKKTGRPIFRTIFNAMMLVMLVEVVLLAVSIAITNVGRQAEPERQATCSTCRCATASATCRT